MAMKHARQALPLVALSALCAATPACMSPSTLTVVADSSGIKDPIVLAGQVDLASLGYRTQATINDIAVAATVSVIDIQSGATVAVALTNAAGAFQFSGGALKVTAGRAYYLEAVKGLGNNVAGKDACRVRTIIKAITATTFASLSGAVVGSPVSINESTTALSIIDTLRSDVGPDNLIGSLAVGSGGQDVFSPGSSGVASNEFTTVRSLVSQALQRDIDPFMVSASGGSYGQVYAATPVVTSVSPNPVAFGRDITVAGANFEPTESGFQVLFGVQVCTVVTSSATSLLIRLPASVAPGMTAVTQAITVKQGLKVSPGVNLTLLPLLSGAMPAW